MIRQIVLAAGLVAFGLQMTGCSSVSENKCEMAVTAKVTLPGADLQAVLDSGEDLVLKKGAVYILKDTLRFKNDNQKIMTLGAKSISDYAILRPADKSVQQLVNGQRKDHILLKNVVVDGFRRKLSGSIKVYKVPQAPLVQFGELDGNYQTIEECVFMDTRTWSTVKIHEGGNHCRVINNIILGAGVGPRGNGREASEKPFSWGDGITCASRNTTIANNLILDTTDVGAVLFGAPGSVVQDNVIATISRESLGGINLVDPLMLYKMDDDGERTDYRGSKLINNYVDAYGGRIHIAFPMGAAIWVPDKAGKILFGAEIRGNTVAGGAGGYGFVAHGVENFKITDNISTATYSGLADGLGDRLPEKPGPFIFDKESVVNCELQDEFKPAKRHVLHLLRCNHGPVNKLGYRVYRYGDDEIEAVVTAAYNEMLGREPSLQELTHFVRSMQKTLQNSDWLRRHLMSTKEFKALYGPIPEAKMQFFRSGLWLSLINKAIRDNESGEYPSARELYADIRKMVICEKSRRSVRTDTLNFINDGVLTGK